MEDLEKQFEAEMASAGLQMKDLTMDDDDEKNAPDDGTA